MNKDFRVAKSVYQWFEKLRERLEPLEVKFLRLLLIVTRDISLLNLSEDLRTMDEEDGWRIIASKLIGNEVGKMYRWKELANKGFIEQREKMFGRRGFHQFRLKPSLLDEINQMDQLAGEFVNLHTGRSLE